MSVYKELGNKLKDFISAKTEEVDDKVEAIDKHERYVNTELDYGTFTLATDITSFSVGVKLLLQKINGSIELNDEGNIVLLSNKTYKITLSCVSDGRVDIAFCNANTGEEICNSIVTGGILSVSGSFIYHADDNISIYPHICYVENAKTIWKAHTHIVIQEINRQIVIDPVEHVNESQGIEDTPVGHIIAHMGTVAPKHYLICNGAEYNITDYPYLAQHIEDNFGSISFFGGDGETTFRVPDLRGEFLRGSGTATRKTGSGAAVGVHQDGTRHQNFYVGTANLCFYGDVTTGANNYDRSITNTTNGKKINHSTYSSNSSAQYFNSRPTNTSVLYCIKYEPTYFMNTYNTNYIQPSLYSEEERVIGSWIDGRPLYQKVVHTGKITEQSTEIPLNIENIEIIMVTDSYIVDEYNYFIPMTYTNSAWTQYSSSVFINKDSNAISIRKSSQQTINDSYVILQYTKTTDEENSFTNDMLKESYVKLDSTCTDEELQQAISDMVEEINAEEDTPETIDEPETEVAEGGQV